MPTSRLEAGVPHFEAPPEGMVRYFYTVPFLSQLADGLDPESRVFDPRRIGGSTMLVRSSLEQPFREGELYREYRLNNREYVVTGLVSVDSITEPGAESVQKPDIWMTPDGQSVPVDHVYTATLEYTGEGNKTKDVYKEITGYAMYPYGNSAIRAEAILSHL